MDGIVNIIMARGCRVFVGGSYKTSICILLCPFGFLKLILEVVDCIKQSSNDYLGDAISLQEISEAGINVSSVKLMKQLVQLLDVSFSFLLDQLLLCCSSLSLSLSLGGLSRPSLMARLRGLTGFISP